MELDKAQKAAELIKELEELKDAIIFQTNKPIGAATHIVISGHWENKPHQIPLNLKYTPRFLTLLEQIAQETKDELDAL